MLRQRNIRGEDFPLRLFVLCETIAEHQDRQFRSDNLTCEVGRDVTIGGVESDKIAGHS